MNTQTILQHMNEHHKNELIALCKKYGKAQALINDEVQNVELTNVDFEGLDIIYNDNASLRVEFPQKANENTLKDAIITLCQGAKTADSKDIGTEIATFKKEFGSIIIASVDKNGYAVVSYAPLMQIHDKLYIYISEVAEHFASISVNPDKIEIFFLEDESKAKSVILRKRLKYRAEARFIERDCEEFTQALNQLESTMDGAGGIKTIRQMQDFHLIELKLGLGRFVKGFGAAYDILPNGEIKQVFGGSGNPHGKSQHNPHKHS